MTLKTVILAAGKGTRMKSERPKVIHKVNGKPMISHISETLDILNPEEKIFILGYKKEVVLDTLGSVTFVTQDEQLGTGHAIIQARPLLENYDGDVLITCGDTPLFTKETLHNFYSHYKNNNADASVLTSLFENPFGYGRILKDNKNGNILKIIEEKEANEEEKAIKEVNSGVYIFNSKLLFKALESVSNKNEKGEYYLTDVIEILSKESHKIISYLIEDNLEMLGVNSKADLALASKVLRERKNLNLMNNGVILIDPNNTYIEEDVAIDEDTIIYPGALLQGNTSIGKNCEILGNTRIIDSSIENNVKIESSVIENSTIENSVTIGPFAHLRPKAYLSKNVHIGNFVEIKDSILRAGVKAGHLTYIGNSDIDVETNIGAGTITCNYDGKVKSKTTIGKNVFIGSGTMLVAPVTIGDRAFIGAGSVITKEVPEDSLGIERNKQNNILNWRNKKND